MPKQRTSIPRAVRDGILKEFSHHCARCEADKPEVHHIDEDPSNNDPLNLIPLCPNCHHNWLHSQLFAVDRRKLQLFRLHKHPLILAPQFDPLFKRLLFLDDIKDNSDTDDLRTKAGELIRLVREHAMGNFYAGKIAGLIVMDRFHASFSVGLDGRVPQWYIDGKNRERPQYLQKLRNSRSQVYELVVEMLSYQKWEKTSS